MKINGPASIFTRTSILGTPAFWRYFDELTALHQLAPLDTIFLSIGHDPMKYSKVGDDSKYGHSMHIPVSTACFLTQQELSLNLRLFFANMNYAVNYLPLNQDISNDEITRDIKIFEQPIIDCSSPFQLLLVRSRAQLLRHLWYQFTSSERNLKLIDKNPLATLSIFAESSFPPSEKCIEDALIGDILQEQYWAHLPQNFEEGFVNYHEIVAALKNAKNDNPIFDWHSRSLNTSLNVLFAAEWNDYSATQAIKTKKAN